MTDKPQCSVECVPVIIILASIVKSRKFPHLQEFRASGSCEYVVFAGRKSQQGDLSIDDTPCKEY